jgi:arylamine N-acetyltransferase
MPEVEPPVPDEPPVPVEPPVSDELVDRYLRRIGVEREPISAQALRRLHSAHVERVPYENLDIVMAALDVGTAPSIDPLASVRRVAAGRGGYCYHLNGAFSAVLRALGYDVQRHVGAVWQAARTPGSASPTQSLVDRALGNHCALTVDVDGQCWFADLGLGDALHEPVLLQQGWFTQGPFTYCLLPSDALTGGWRFQHDPAQGSFTAMDFGLEPVGMDRFAPRHHELSTAPDSPFVTVLTAQRRDGDGVDALRGCVLTRHDATGRHERELSTRSDWFDAAIDVFDLPVVHWDESLRTRVWQWLQASHETWLTSRR